VLSSKASPHPGANVRLRAIPSPLAIAALTLGAVLLLVLLIFGMPVARAGLLAAATFTALVGACLLDFLKSRRDWRDATPTLARHLPAAFAIGVHRPVTLSLALAGTRNWRINLHDHADATLLTQGMPVELLAPANKITEVHYTVTPTRRGNIEFSPADISIRSGFGLLDLRTRIGGTETRRVYPDFAQVARYAWLAGDRRLAEIGIKTYQQRGEGTDFKQLSEYRTGDAVRHIDWKATLRFDKPVVRQFQNERDQCVMLLIDCGRRMRADDRQGGIGTAHFDQVLNAAMLLTYVALKQGDAVGAMTFGTPAGEERWFTPRKGAVTLNALMGELFDVQPTPTHSDYLSAAQTFLLRQRKRALVIVITNFRDEDSNELGQALKLLRSRHLVMTASLKEGVVSELADQPLATNESALEVASAHLYEQARRDAFNRIAARDSLMVDAEPQRLGIELVNRYHAVKRAGMI
jgi:uncharacterized protein (DUF58 family)